MPIQLAPVWGDAQLEFEFQKICARWGIDYLALRNGEPSVEFKGEGALDDARNQIAGLILTVLKMKDRHGELAARGAFAAGVLMGRVDLNAIGQGAYLVGRDLAAARSAFAVDLLTGKVNPNVTVHHEEDPSDEPDAPELA